MPPDVAVITAIYDRYDVLKPVCSQAGVSAEWVLVTDDPRLASGHPGWRVVYEPRPGVPPLRAAKAPKYRPWRYTAAAASVWVDGSLQITSPYLAEVFLAAADPVAMFAHPARDCLFDEAEVSAAMPRYAAEPLAAQAEHYRQAGHPEHAGLWETGIIARHHGPRVRALGDAWAAETDRWSAQDQVSFPVALRTAGLRPAVLPGRGLISPWHRWEGSRRHDSDRAVPA